MCHHHTLGAMREFVDILKFRSSHHHQAQCPSQRLPQNFHNSGKDVTWGRGRGCYKWVKSTSCPWCVSFTSNALTVLKGSSRSQIFPEDEHFHISPASELMSAVRTKHCNPSDANGKLYVFVLANPSIFLWRKSCKDHQLSPTLLADSHYKLISVFLTDRSFKFEKTTG